MKEKSTKINRFIELRASGYTYDEIIVLINVSKPTLIHWGKTYSEHIKTAELVFAEALGRKLTLKNKPLMEAITDAMVRICNGSIKGNEPKDRIIRRIRKKLFKIFKVKMDRIELTLNNDNTLRNVNIIWREK